MSYLKKSLLATAITGMMFSGSAFADGANSDAAKEYLTKDSFSYEVYGIIAMQVRTAITILVAKQLTTIWAACS